MTEAPKIVSNEQWLAARKALLDQEKAFTKARDELSRQRRALPWRKVERDYRFEGPDGRESLADLFAGRAQLLVQHFMFGPDWDEGCPSCSFWADGYDGFQVHLAQRDVAMVSVSRASQAKIDAYKRRLGWTFKWVTAIGDEFNRDFAVTFTPEQIAAGDNAYNYGSVKFGGEEAPGISVFARDDAGAVYHTYSCYGRGLDMMNAAYHYLDLLPQGRNEDDLPYPMAWLRRNDSYAG